MRVLVIGGSGFVGGMVLPRLAAQHEICVFDRRPPAHDVPWIGGDVADFGAVSSALRDRDAVLFMAMGPAGGWDDPAAPAAHFDVSPKGLYLALRAAREAGITRAVYTSSMSVYIHPDERPDGRYPEESAPTDATDFYGLAKRCGELVCAAAVAEGMHSVVALRLCHPTPDDRWPPEGTGVRAAIATSAADTAAALLAALDFDGAGFEPIAISGDAAGRHVRLEKAARLLGWEPSDPTPVRSA